MIRCSETQPLLARQDKDRRGKEASNGKDRARVCNGLQWGKQQQSSSRQAFDQHQLRARRRRKFIESYDRNGTSRAIDFSLFSIRFTIRCSPRARANQMHICFTHFPLAAPFRPPTKSAVECHGRSVLEAKPKLSRVANLFFFSFSRAVERRWKKGSVRHDRRHTLR